MESKKNMTQAFKRLVVGLCLQVMIVLIPFSIPVEAQRCGPNRAMWIYQCPYDVVRNRTERDAVFAFAVNREIAEFFLRVSVQCEPSGAPLGVTCRLDDSTYRDNLRLVNRKAHHRNIRVHALYDDTTLALAPEHNRARAFVQTIVEFNNRSQADQRFDGIHLDVEPHTLARYRNGTWAVRRDILRQYLDMNAAVVEEIAGQNLSYGVDVPDTWYPFVDENGVFQERRNLLMDYRDRNDYPTMHLMDMVKEIAIMAYHRNPDTTIRKTDYAMAYAADVGALVYIGVQTSPHFPDVRCPGQRERACSETFGIGCGTETEMEGAFCTIETQLGDYPSFLGFSLFKYSSYRDMLE